MSQFFKNFSNWGVTIKVIKGTDIDVIMSVLIDRGRAVVHVPIVWTKIVIIGNIPIHVIIALFQLGIICDWL